jgi:nucleotide-binding universal stress UspA family protein
MRGTADAPSDRMTFQNILVPIDFDETSDQALKIATALAMDLSASITVLHTVEIPPYAYAYFGAALPPPDMLSTLETAARQSLEQKVGTVRATVPSVKSILTTGVPWRQILAGIEDRKADLVVMGTHARRGVERMLLGSVAEKIVRASPVPVLTVPPPR